VNSCYSDVSSYVIAGHWPLTSWPQASHQLNPAVHSSIALALSNSCNKSPLNVELMEIDQDNLHMKFSALNADFSSSSPDPISSRRPAQAGVKEKYPLKSGYFTAIGSCSVKTVAVRYILAAHHHRLNGSSAMC